MNQRRSAQMNKQAKTWLALAGAFVVIMLIPATGLASDRRVNNSHQIQYDEIKDVPATTRYDMFNLHLGIPEGSRIDYLRVFYYDTSEEDSIAWITTYDGAGSISDITSVTSSGNSGYGTQLSDYVGEVVDNASNSYVLNWRPVQVGTSMQLCGLRVAYRLPDGGGGFDPSFSYRFVTGAAFRPRSSNTPWEYPGAGCVSADFNKVYVPSIYKAP
jgi:hypothetical protein